MADADESEQELQPGDALPRWQRFVFTAMGLGGLGGGTAATFITKNSVGSGVLLALGAVFALMGLTGNPITRLKLGDSEATFGLRRTLRNAMRSPKEEVRQDVAEEVLESDLPSSDPLRQEAQAVKSALSYEAEALEALKRTGLHITVPARNSHDQIDSIVHLLPNAPSAAGRRDIGVEVKFGSGPLAAAVVDQTVGYIQRPGRKLHGFLIITNRPPTASALRLLTDHPEIRIAIWHSPKDDDAINNALIGIVPLDE